MMRVPTAIVSILLIFSIVGCKKEDYTVANGKRLVKIIQRWHDSLYYTSFKYDQDGRVAEVIGTDPKNTPLDTIFTSIEYNAQGQMLNYRYRHNKGYYSHAYTFIYDTNGRIIQLRSLPTNSLIKTYAYDPQGRLVTDSRFYHTLNTSIPWGIFEYDNSGDVVKGLFQYYDSYSRKIDTSAVFEASYNNSPNSLADLGPTLYHILHYHPYVLSKHNVSQFNYDGYIRIFTYEYYPDGLMKKVIYNNDHEYYDEFLYE